jgi:hypothetical protein
MTQESSEKNDIRKCYSFKKVYDGMSINPTRGPSDPPPCSDERPDSDTVTVTAAMSTGLRRTIACPMSALVSDLISALESDSAVSRPPDSTTVIFYRGRVLDPQESLASLGAPGELSVLAFFRLPSDPPVSPDALEGFDRLLRMDYSEGEIASIRAEFHAVRGAEEEPPRVQAAAEEEWFTALFGGAGAGAAFLATPRAGEARELSLWTVIFLFVTAFFSALCFGPVAFLVLFFSCSRRASVFGLMLGLLSYSICSTYTEIISSVRIS